MPIPATPSGWRWALAQPSTHGILIAAFAALIGIPSALNYASQGRRWLAVTVAGGTLGASHSRLFSTLSD